MQKTIILVPSRGRPGNLDRMALAANRLAAHPGDLVIMAAIDEDDPTRSRYRKVEETHGNLTIYSGIRDSLCGWTNFLAKAAIDKYGIEDTYLISLGDDHRVKSTSWETKLINAIKRLDGPGFAYGDDTFNGPKLCTAWMASASLVDRLGWMMLPTCKHMYVDNCIMELGLATNRISYVKSVTIEHLHPISSRVGIDQTYIDGSASINKDSKAFKEWRHGEQFSKDVNTVKELQWSHPEIST